ncbi:MAG: DoxX family membrane protein [Polaribacter sp.]|nr:DoxX family membrane protein [Polaribacter sp.]MDG1810327.1 DoxX family membrane protein [Polaribacter sp.]MDG1994306.1 DoxX family membrane protein [Polaribacter sp.]
MKLLVHISRIFVGAIFIFSGFVKLVDPIGSQYKFEEYFSQNVLDMEYLIPYALAFSILLILAEIILGVTLLLGYKARTTLWSLLVLSTVFLFLTWYSAYYNKVTDCGCFGDAIKLTPWETFYKNILLIALIVVMLFRMKNVKEIFPTKVSQALTILSLVSFLYITYHVLVHLPIIDFRPYAIGNNIPEGMKYKDDGEIPKIHDFYLEDAQADLAPEILAQNKVILIIVHSLDKADTNGFKTIKELADKAIAKGYSVYGVSASFTDELLLAKEKYELPFDFLFCDQTTLKTMVRANPGIMMLEKGTITGKWNWSDADEIELK